MKNSTIYIGLGVAALAVVGFFVYRKTQGSAEDMETRGAELDSETNTPTSTASARPTPSSTAASSSTAVSTPTAPTTTSAPPVTSAADSQDILFLAYGITQKNYDKMIEKKTKIEAEADAAQLPQTTKLDVVRTALIDFAKANGINFIGFKKAYQAKNPTVTVEGTPSAPARRDCRAEAEEATKNLPRLMRAPAKLAYIVKCKREGGEGFAFAFAMDDEQYDMLNY